MSCGGPWRVACLSGAMATPLRTVGRSSDRPAWPCHLHRRPRRHGHARIDLAGLRMANAWPWHPKTKTMPPPATGGPSVAQDGVSVATDGPSVAPEIASVATDEAFGRGICVETRFRGHRTGEGAALSVGGAGGMFCGGPCFSRQDMATLETWLEGSRIPAAWPWHPERGQPVLSTQSCHRYAASSWRSCQRLYR